MSDSAEQARLQRKRRASLTPARRSGIVRRLRSTTKAIADARRARLDVVREARDAGLSLTEIAEACGMSRSGAKKLVSQIGDAS